MFWSRRSQAGAIPEASNVLTTPTRKTGGFSGLLLRGQPPLGSDSHPLAWTQSRQADRQDSARAVSRRACCRQSCVRPRRVAPTGRDGISPTVPRSLWRPLGVGENAVSGRRGGPRLELHSRENRSSEGEAGEPGRWQPVPAQSLRCHHGGRSQSVREQGRALSGPAGAALLLVPQPRTQGLPRAGGATPRLRRTYRDAAGRQPGADDGLHQVFVVDTKGVQLKASEDTKYKRPVFNIFSEHARKAEWADFVPAMRSREMGFGGVDEDSARCGSTGCSAG